ncbi:MAG: hypothetical protein N4A40_05170 [Tissierellales bacterium]|jgi:hypothetical protein|nr:hypothetical protein [Tissierellales bacterium]
MSTSLEKIDLIKNRTHVSYAVAKDALERNNNDLVETLIYLENNNLIINIEQIGYNQKKQTSFMKKLKKFLLSYTIVTNRKKQRIFQMQTILTLIIIVSLLPVSIPFLIITLPMKQTWDFVSLDSIEPLAEPEDDNNDSKDIDNQ